MSAHDLHNLLFSFLSFLINVNVRLRISWNRVLGTVWLEQYRKSNRCADSSIDNQTIESLDRKTNSNFIDVNKCIEKINGLEIKNTPFLNLTWCEENRENKEAKSDDDTGYTNTDLQSKTDS